MDADLKHIVTSVCGINDTQVAYKAVNVMGIGDVTDFAALTQGTIFQYDNAAGVKTDINTNHQLKLSQAITYTVHMQKGSDPDANTPANWTKAQYPSWVAQQAAIVSAAVPASNPYATSSKDKFQLETFLKTPKPLGDYTILKDEAFWYTFKLDLERTTKNHHCYRLISSAHKEKKDFEATLTPGTLDSELFRVSVQSP